MIVEELLSLMVPFMKVKLADALKYPDLSKHGVRMVFLKPSSSFFLGAAEGVTDGSRADETQTQGEIMKKLMSNQELLDTTSGELTRGCSQRAMTKAALQR